MNTLSGYAQFTLKSGDQIAFKFSQGAYMLYAESQGITSLEDMTRSLQPPLDEAGQPVVDIPYMTALRRLITAAAVYAAKVEKRPVDFDEWTVQEWIDEIGYDQILAAIEPVQPDPNAKASKKKEAPKATIK